MASSGQNRDPRDVKVPLTVIRRKQKSTQLKISFPTATDPFHTDIKLACVQLVRNLIASSNPGVDSSYHIYLQPPTPLDSTGCWCQDISTPRSHTWKNCPVWNPRSIVASDATIQLCPHNMTLTPEHSDTEATITMPVAHLFCFNPYQAMEDYISWFIQIPGPPSSDMNRSNANYLYSWIQNQYCNSYVGDVARVQKTTSQYFQLLARFFVELCERPPSWKRFGGWYDAERVHAMLKWNQRTERECMDILLPLITEAKIRRESIAGSVAIPRDAEFVTNRSQV